MGDVLTKEKLMEIVDNVDNDMLERNEADLILNMLYSDRDEISKAELQQIVTDEAGGCAAAAMLSLELLRKLEEAQLGVNDSILRANKGYLVGVKPKTEEADLGNVQTDFKGSIEYDAENFHKLENRLDKLEERLNKLEGKSQDVQKEIDTGWVWPAPGYNCVISGFGEAKGLSHVCGAIDIAGTTESGSIYGASIVAANSGTVSVACGNGYGGGYGNYVVIKHGNGRSTVYGHLSAISVSKGENVAGGQEIGKAGSSGFTTSPHLHFEYRVNGVRTNPKSILKY